MAEEKAGQEHAQDPKNPPQDDAQDPPAQKPKVYSQEEVDRIAAKVRKNARRDTELSFRRQQQDPQGGEKREDPAPPKEEEEPKREDFETYEDHQRAVAKFEGKRGAREEVETREKKAREETQRQASATAEREWKSKIASAEDKHPDFQDVLEDNGDTFNLIYDAPMKGAIVQSDIGPEIVFYLCATEAGRAEAKRISELKAYKQAAEIAKIEDKLLAEGKPAPKAGEEDKDPDEPADETPEAKEERERKKNGQFKSNEKKDPPPPIEPGSGRPAASSSLPSDKDDAETWRRKELARMRKVQGK